ncbi:MAG: murein biosynthesis integral membrane protein MurJ [Anaerolineae bacterium]|nr:murein biosynthesis integral membrane protein MurJ [Anaerolineae bacterium]
MSKTQPLDTPGQSAGGRALSGQQITRAAGLVMVGFILSRVLGLARDAIISAIFGNGMVFDAYVAASQPPETLFFVIAGGALGSAFIPTFASYLEQNKREEAWRMANTVIGLIALIMVVLAGLFAVFAKPIVVSVLAVDFDPEKQALTAGLMQVMLISPVIFGISGLLTGILNTHQRFLLPALAPSLYNLGIIGGAVFLSPSMGIYGAAWGVVIGAALYSLIQLPGIVALKPPRLLAFDLRHPGVHEVLRLMGPRVIGLAIVQANFWINILLASGMVDGSLGALRRAFTVMLLPQGVIAQSVANAVFPTFSIYAARDDKAQLRSTLGQVLRAVLFLSLPATIGLIVLRLPVVRLLYERGAFTLPDSQATAWALLFYGLGLVFHSLLEVVTRAYYALHDTRTPVLIGGGAMILNVILSLALMQVIGQPGSLVMGPFAGLALANTLATMLESIILLALIRSRIGGLEGRSMLSSVGRAGAAGAVMGIALWMLLPLIDRVGLLIGTIGAVALGGLLFWGVAWVLGSEEARLFTSLALRRLRRSEAS